MIWPQTSLAYLAAVAERVGLSVDIVDCIAESISWSEYRTILETCKPRYCFSNIISVTYNNDLRALSLAKEIAGSVTVGMGPHITDRPAETLRYSNALDFVICHEAEATLEELLRTCESRQPLSTEVLSSVKGIGFVPSRLTDANDDKPTITAQRPFIENLDELPRARHDLLPLDKYWAPFLGHYTFVEASRGCAYRCIFCRQAVMWQWKYRRRSAKAIVEEALYVHSLGVDNILFHADTFTLDSELVKEVCAELIEAGSPFRWACNTHARNLHKKPELLGLMKQAGCWMIAIGIESGDDTILRNIKKQTTTEQIREVVNAIARAGIEPWGYFVLGFPGDTTETMERTIRFATSLPLKMAKFDVAAPYPGTEFYRYAKSKGYLRADCYEQFDQNASPVVEYPGLSRKQIRHYVRKATRRFYLRPQVLWRVAKQLLQPTTLKTTVWIIRDHILLLSGRKRRRKPTAV
jgi:radical SAM superfamily enzyme YgiQ (UPF0313 family)